MKHFGNAEEHDLKLFGILLQPSLLSGTVAAVFSVGLSVFVIASARYRGSNAQLQFLNYNADSSHATTQTVGNILATNRIISNLPLFLFWALVGLVVYMFATNIVGAVRSAAEVADEMEHFVNVNRRQLIRGSVEKLGIRLLVLIVWVPYILLFFHWLVPFVIASAFAGSAELGSAVGIGYVALSIAVMFLALHLHVILLRLLALRPRLFSSALYVD